MKEVSEHNLESLAAWQVATQSFKGVHNRSDAFYWNYLETSLAGTSLLITVKSTTCVNNEAEELIPPKEMCPMFHKDSDWMSQ
ncbi:hypothetical protein BgiMline_025749 [Biomphalaria glabrata]|nr:hypothetical protein BgiMline_021802 [Biomphalaria glabrata]